MYSLRLSVWRFAQADKTNHMSHRYICGDEAIPPMYPLRKSVRRFAQPDNTDHMSHRYIC